MPSDSDTLMASFIVKFMITHQKIALNVLKEKFSFNDQQLREAIIRLYFRGKIFGKIQDNFLEIHD